MILFYMYTRKAVSSDGKFYGCLFATVDGFNVKAFIRSGVTNEELKEQFEAMANKR